MTGPEAEKRYYEIYAQHMRDVRDYHKPIVQQEIRAKTWAMLVAEIERDVIATAVLPGIESDATGAT